MSPIHDYQCTNCGHAVIDVWHQQPYANPLECPLCKEWMYPQIGAVSLKFLGDGFYVNDYKESSSDDEDGDNV